MNGLVSLGSNRAQQVVVSQVAWEVLSALAVNDFSSSVDICTLVPMIGIGDRFVNRRHDLFLWLINGIVAR